VQAEKEKLDKKRKKGTDEEKTQGRKREKMLTAKLS